MTSEKKTYPQFTPGNTPNRAQRRKDCGINKRGLYKIQEGRYKLLVSGPIKWKHFIQLIPLKDSSGRVLGFKKVTHTTR